LEESQTPRSSYLSSNRSLPALSLHNNLSTTPGAFQPYPCPRSHPLPSFSHPHRRHPPISHHKNLPILAPPMAHLTSRKTPRNWNFPVPSIQRFLISLKLFVSPAQHLVFDTIFPARVSSRRAFPSPTFRRLGCPPFAADPPAFCWVECGNLGSRDTLLFCCSFAPFGLAPEILLSRLFSP